MASDITELRAKINKYINDDTKPWASWFKYLEETYGLNRYYVFWGLVVLIIVWLALGYAGQLLSNFIGVLYPAYASIHAIESRSAVDDTKWLTYWVVFSGFSIIEYFAYYIVGWFPLYWLIKGVISVWLMIPTNLNGSLIVYRNIIKPYFLQYHEAVDDVISVVQNTASEFIDKNK